MKTTYPATEFATDPDPINLPDDVIEAMLHALQTCMPRCHEMLRESGHGISAAAMFAWGARFIIEQIVKGKLRFTYEINDAGDREFFVEFANASKEDTVQ